MLVFPRVPSLSPQFTYGAKDKDGTTTHGGYSSHVVVNDKFALHVPDNLPLASTAPLLCAGITTYSPIKRFGFDKPGLHIGVVGLVSKGLVELLSCARGDSDGCGLS